MCTLSIITVCYNAEKTITNTIESILEQTYRNFEYIVIDGNSTDSTYKIVCTYDEKFKKRGIKYYHFSEPDKGIFDAMNKGIYFAHGKYINFMNSDDRFHNSEVLEMVFEKQMTADVVYGDTFRISKFECWETKSDSIELMKWNMPFCHQSSFTKTSIMKETPFDLNYRVADYNFFLRLYLNNGVFEHINVIISDYSMEGYSNKEKYKTYLGTLKIKEDLGLIDSKSLKQKIKNNYFKLLLSDNIFIKYIDGIYRNYKKWRITK